MKTPDVTTNLAMISNQFDGVFFISENPRK